MGVINIPNKNYQSGRRFEYKVKKYLEDKGYYVMRSAGSKSAFDLVAISNTRLLLIQCKYGKSISKKEQEKLEYLSTQLMGECMVALSKKNGKLIFYHHQATWGWIEPQI